MKTTITKTKPHEIIYIDCKNFDSILFNNELKFVLDGKESVSCSNFDNLFFQVLDKHAPLKKKMLRANHSSYVSKPLRKAIMRRSYLEKMYFKKRTVDSLTKYKKQKNYCSRLYKKERKKFFDNLNPSIVEDNKTFWKTVKPFLTNKGSKGGNIKLLEKGELLQEYSLIAEEFNNFFKNTVSSLDKNENSFIINNEAASIYDPIEKAISKYKFHPSILLIKETIKSKYHFSFQHVEKSDIDKETRLLNPRKATPQGTIPAKLLKLSSNVSSGVLHTLFNEMVTTDTFSDNLKKADITPADTKKIL